MKSSVCLKDIRRRRRTKYRSRRISCTGKPLLRRVSRWPQRVITAGFQCAGEHRRPAPPDRSTARLATTAHSVRIKIAPSVVHVATQLTPFFRRQAIAANRRRRIAQRHGRGAWLDGHRSLLAAAGAAFWRRARWLLRQDRRGQQPGGARQADPSHPFRPAFCPHVCSSIAINPGYCKPARRPSGSRPSGCRSQLAVRRRAMPTPPPKPC